MLQFCHNYISIFCDKYDNLTTALEGCKKFFSDNFDDTHLKTHDQFGEANENNIRELFKKEKTCLEAEKDHMLALYQKEKTCLEATRTLELAVLEKEKICLMAERDLQYAFIQKEMICQEAANTLRLAVANSASVDSTMVLETINALVEGDKFQAMPVNDEPGENSTAMNEKPSNALGEGNKAQAKNKAPAKKAQAKKKQV